MLQMRCAVLSSILDVASAANASDTRNKAERLNMNELHGSAGVGLCQ